MTVTHTSAIDLDATRLLAERYAQAWNEHDLDAIMSMHGSTSTFHLHVRPYSEADAHDAIRQQFAAILIAFPDLRFETARLEVRPGLFTHEWDMIGTLAAPLALGDRFAEPVGQHVRVRGVDVISCEDGRVRRKDCFLDAIELELQLFRDSDRTANAANGVTDVADGRWNAMSAHPNVGKLRAAYESFASRDVAAVLAALEPDVVFHVNGTGPMAGDRRGHEAVGAFLAHTAQLTGGTQRFQINGVFADDQHGVVIVHETATRATDGVTLAMPEVHLIRFGANGGVSDFWDVPQDATVHDGFFEGA